MKVFIGSWSVLIIVSLLSLMYLIGYALFSIPEINSNAATLIGGIFSFSGGAIGAMGAYLVARHQIEQEKKQDKIKLLASELPVYIGLTLEFDKIVKHLQDVEKYKASNQLIAEDSLIITFDALRWDRWTDINKITDSILLKELIFFEESFKRIIEVLEYDINSQAIKLYLSLDGTEARDLEMEINTIKIEKPMYFKELTYSLQKAEKIQKVIKDKISTIEELVEGKSKIENYCFITSNDIFKPERDDRETEHIKVTSNLM